MSAPTPQQIATDALTGFAYGRDISREEAWQLVCEVVEAEREQSAEWEAARETEWEYGIRDEGEDGPFTDHYESISAMSDDFDGFLAQRGEEIIRRRKTGPWLPVPDPTNNESED